MRIEQVDYTEWGEEPDEEDELEVDDSEYYGPDHWYGADSPVEEGAGILTIAQVRLEERLQQMELEHSPKPKPYAGCELCHWQGKVQTERGYRVCDCAKRQRVWESLGDLGKVGQQLDPETLRAATRFKTWSNKSKVVLGSWQKAMPNIIHGLARENLIRLNYFLDTTGGITGAAKALVSVNLTTDKAILAWDLAEEAAEVRPASSDYEVVVIRLGYSADPLVAAGHVLTECLRRQSDGLATWLWAPEMPGPAWSPGLLHFAAGSDVVRF